MLRCDWIGCSASLDGDLLLTTAEAAERLGIRSVEIVKEMVYAGQIPALKVGGHYRIPLAEIERVRVLPAIQDLLAADRIHEETAMLGATQGMSQAEMDILSEARPGTRPWQRCESESLGSGLLGPNATH